MLESSKVPALTRAIDILNLIARIGPCSAATIIDELGIPKSTAYLLLGETLTALQWVACAAVLAGIGVGQLPSGRKRAQAVATGG